MKSAPTTLTAGTLTFTLANGAHVEVRDRYDELVDAFGPINPERFSLAVDGWLEARGMGARVEWPHGLTMGRMVG